MIIIRERQIDYKSDLREPEEVAKFFDLIDTAFGSIDMALSELSLIFFNKNWYLKESQQETLLAYQKAAKIIRDRLTELSMMNSTLIRFLALETRPIPIDVDAPYYMDERTKSINSQLKHYYKKIKGTQFPDFGTEIQEHKKIIITINRNIDRINEINSAYRPRHVIRHIRNLSI